MRTLTYCLSGLLLLASFTAPALSNDTNKAQPLTIRERFLVEEALNAYSIQIDPEYYISGSFLNGSETTEARKRRQQHHLRLIETRRRQALHQEKKAAHQAEQKRIAEERRRVQMAHRAHLHAKRIENQIYRCRVYRTQDRHRQTLAAQNPNYSYRRLPTPPGC